MTNRRPNSLFLVLALYLGLLAGAARAGIAVGNGSPASWPDAAHASGLTVDGPGMLNRESVAHANASEALGGSSRRSTTER